MKTCEAPKALGLIGLFGPRCGEPADFFDGTRTLCEYHARAIAESLTKGTSILGIAYQKGCEERGEKPLSIEEFLTKWRITTTQEEGESQ